MRNNIDRLIKNFILVFTFSFLFSTTLLASSIWELSEAMFANKVEDVRRILSDEDVILEDLYFRGTPSVEVSEELFKRMDLKHFVELILPAGCHRLILMKRVVYILMKR